MIVRTDVLCTALEQLIDPNLDIVFLATFNPNTIVES